jgi:hypothetical protein
VKELVNDGFGAWEAAGGAFGQGFDDAPRDQCGDDFVQQVGGEDGDDDRTKKVVAEGEHVGGDEVCAAAGDAAEHVQADGDGDDGVENGDDDAADDDFPPGFE